MQKQLVLSIMNCSNSLRLFAAFYIQGSDDKIFHNNVQYAPREEKEKTKLKPNKACVLLPVQDLIAQSLVSSSK